MDKTHLITYGVIEDTDIDVSINSKNKITNIKVNTAYSGVSFPGLKDFKKYIQRLQVICSDIEAEYDC